MSAMSHGHTSLKLSHCWDVWCSTMAQPLRILELQKGLKLGESSQHKVNATLVATTLATKAMQPQDFSIWTYKEGTRSVRQNVELKPLKPRKKGATGISFNIISLLIGRIWVAWRTYYQNLSDLSVPKRYTWHTLTSSLTVNTDVSWFMVMCSVLDPSINQKP